MVNDGHGCQRSCAGGCVDGRWSIGRQKTRSSKLCCFSTTSRLHDESTYYSNTEYCFNVTLPMNAVTTGGDHHPGFLPTTSRGGGLRRPIDNVTNTPHQHTSPVEIDEEQNQEQTAAYYEGQQQSVDYDYHDDILQHCSDNDIHQQQRSVQRPQQSHYTSVQQEQERGERGWRGTETSGAARHRAQQSPPQQQQHHQQQHRTILDVHHVRRATVPEGEDTEELTEPLLQQASTGKQGASHGPLKREQSKSGTLEHQPNASPAAATSPPSNVGMSGAAPKLSPTSSNSSSSLSSKASKASKTSKASASRNRLRKSRSKDAQTEIEHPKAPLVVAEDSEDLDDDENEEEKEQENNATTTKVGDRE
uniref:Uncharacterized protein n=1 Tax=Anopheles atroparvus TaxID=41427 RepID=A0A182J021_ANOAO